MYTFTQQTESRRTKTTFVDSCLVEKVIQKVGALQENISHPAIVEERQGILFAYELFGPAKNKWKCMPLAGF